MKKRQVKFKRQFIIISLLLISSIGLYYQLVRLGYIPPLSMWIGSSSDRVSQTRLHSPVSGNELLNRNKAIADILSSQAIDLAKTSILIEKSKYRLTIYYDLKAIKSYPVVLGGNPVGDKLKEGDNKTPEGIFKIRDLYPHPDWSKFLWIDYPTEESWQKHLRAKQEGKIAWSDRIGGEVGIHGVPANQNSLIDNRINWTWGCISLTNKDVDELYQYVRAGTIIEIVP